MSIRLMLLDRYTHLFGSRVFLNFHTCPIYTKLKEPLVINGFTADAISRSTFVHGVQRHQETVFQGIWNSHLH